MFFPQNREWQSLLLRTMSFLKPWQNFPSLYCTMPPIPSCSNLHKLCGVVSSSIGGLDELESSLDNSGIPLTSLLVNKVIESCKNEAPTRRLLRFFLWSRKNLNEKLEDKDYNHAIRIFAEKRDYRAMEILISDIGKEGRQMDTLTFSLVADTLVKLGREDEALGIFKNLSKFKCPQDRVTVTAIITALCAKGHAKRAEGVVMNHNDKISGVEPYIYKSLLHGWSEQKNIKEARRIIKEMKSRGIVPDLLCYNTFLRCLCEWNLISNPSGLVPEALNVMMEMRSYQIAPNSVSFNILISCLGRARRVKESLQILEIMRRSGCSPDWVSHYLVARVLYLTGRFGKGKQIVDKMNEEGLVPEQKFYYDLIGVLCGVERMNYAFELFDQMKKSFPGGYGPFYDLLIAKLCRGGEFEKAKELWDEATNKGITLQCLVDLLDPSITEIFKPVRKVKEEVKLLDFTHSDRAVRKSIRKGNKVTKKKKGPSQA